MKKYLLLLPLLLASTIPAQDLRPQVACHGDTQHLKLTFAMARNKSFSMRIKIGNDCPAGTVNVVNLTADQAFIAVQPAGGFEFDVLANTRDIKAGKYYFKLTATSPSWSEPVVIPGTVTVSNK